ncbi:FAD-binding oxidoreductase [Mangrovicoccus algicola]|uniref:FAD-binding oxidoreductase n=1 Tax=Mangrovicoccus algicola TaxID=2771008 RepID=A0A8J7CW45_9RHOB|nr:FAD-binding oxidoreductase [Mangrovicoccus algicola]MBE3639524.1 FAD-binding oxidoreductase [Mangrovicoccus algicola]
MALTGFLEALDGIEVTTDPKVVKAKSRDWHFISPLLSKTLDGLVADAVVTPRTPAEVRAVAAAAHAQGVALTPRGTGTANYGQSVPLHGGAMLDLSKLSGVIEVGPGFIRAHAGTRIADLEAAAAETGQELRFFPTTKKQATIGGFVTGGTGGVGSITYGVLRDPGNIRGLKVVTVEETPREITLTGRDTAIVQHSYGTLGIVTEVEMPLAPKRDWQEALVTLPDYPAAVRLAVAIGQAPGLEKKLASAYEWPIGDWLKPLAPFIGEGRSIVIAMIEAASMPLLREMVAEAGGEITAGGPEGQAPYGRPIWEFAFGHTTLQAQKTRDDITEIEGLFSAPDLAARILEVHAAIGKTGPMRMEIRRWGAELVGSGSTFVTFTDEAAVNEVVTAMRAMGLKVANPHASNVRGVGKKTIGPREIAFKREVDPKGLLNPGRFEAEGAADTVIDRHLDTDGWLDRQAG